MAPEVSDAVLLASTDPNDFGDFYLRHLEAVRAYVALRTKRADLTLDLVAETFARALQHRARYDATRGPAIAWLFGIASNLMIDAARRRRVSDSARRRLGMERVELTDSAFEALDREPDVDVDELLRYLPPDARALILRRFVDGMSYGALAADVGCSEQVVRQRVSRGLATMRRAAGGNQ